MIELQHNIKDFGNDMLVIIRDYYKDIWNKFIDEFWGIGLSENDIIESLQQ